MLGQVKTHNLFFSRHTQADRRADEQEHNGNRHGCPSADRKHTKQLFCKQCNAAAVEQAGEAIVAGGCGRCKKTDCNGTPNAVAEVDGNRADRVIDMELIVEQPNAERAKETGHNADDCRAEAVRYVTAGGDGDQTGERSVETHGNIRLAVLYPCEDHAGDGCYGRCDGGREEDRAELLNACCRSAVEAVPAEPEDKYAKAAERNVVARESIDLYDLAGCILFELADARAEQLCADERGKTAYHVDGAGACKIMEAELRKPAAAPDPVCFDGVYQSGDNTGVNAVGKELCAFCHCAGNDGCGRGAEHKVEYEIRPVKVCVVCENIKARLTDEAQ